MEGSMRSVKVIVAGDVCMRNLTEVMNDSYSEIVLGDVIPVLNKADLKIINLENPLLEDGTPIHKSGPPLKGNPSNISFLNKGGFNFACLANNHMGDYGEEGVLQTLKILRENDIGHAGAGANIDQAYEPYFFKCNDTVTAVIAICENEFGIAEADKAGSAGFNMYRIQKAIKTASKQADFIMIIMHGGNEYNPVPSPMIVSFYRTFIEMGADAVIGMHPHCIQGYEIYEGNPIIYSTGNFLFNKSSDDDEKSSWYYGYLPLITFEKAKKPSLEINPYRFNKDCTRITMFTGSEKEAMIKYIDEISKPIGDDEYLQELFKGWCIISGINHARHLNFKEEFLEEKEFPTGHPLLAMRNLYTCESHNNMVKTFLKLLADGKIEEGRKMTDEIRRLQKMPV